ncbi:DUF4136 domain-containing protein [Shewanella youngdeokensis]|uniref:DUF4136 domain-containing protein n=1 Tax=Shewanella youngdeokensis TaxID=2999068 RepID=A0ABZ0JW32_9GAMM|nr:DUF4136 domain-containing protein [Shewanella sp. DAU334]
MHKLKNILIACIVALPITILTGCSSTSAPKSDYSVGYDFSKLKTFSQIVPPQTPDPLSSKRIEQSIAAALVSAGFVNQTEAPDFLVSYGFKVDDKPKTSGVSIGLGAGSWGKSVGGSIGTSVDLPIGSDSEKVQTIFIDIVDPQSQQLIWRGSNTFDFEDGGEAKAAQTHATVSNILAQFPPKKKQ